MIPSALLWRLEGTLLDCTRLICLAAEEALALSRLRHLKVGEYVELVRSQRGSGFAELLRRRAITGDPQAVLDAFARSQVQRGPDLLGIKPTLRKLLITLHRQSTPMAILSGEPSPLADAYCRWTGIDQVLQAIIGRQFEESRLPSDRAAKAALRRLGVRAGPNVVIVSHLIEDLAAARSLGLSAIGIGWSSTPPLEIEQVGVPAAKTIKALASLLGK